MVSEHESVRSTHDSTAPLADQTVPLTDHKQQRTQISASTPHIAGPEISEYKKVVTSTPVTQHLSTDTINTSTSSLPGEQQRIHLRTHPSTNETNASISSIPREQQRIRSRTQYSTHDMNASVSSLLGEQQRMYSRAHAQHRSRQPDHPRTSRPTSYAGPTNLQGPAAPPWWMYPPAPWWLPPPW